MSAGQHVKIVGRHRLVFTPVVILGRPVVEIENAVIRSDGCGTGRVSLRYVGGPRQAGRYVRQLRRAQR